MPTVTKNVGRSRHIAGTLLVIIWVRADTGVASVAAARNTLNAAANARALEAGAGQAGGSVWFDAPAIAGFDDGITDESWYGRMYRMDFFVLEDKDQTSAYEDDLKAFIRAAFPNAEIQEPNRRFDFPDPSSGIDTCVDWEIEGE